MKFLTTLLLSIALLQGLQAQESDSTDHGEVSEVSTDEDTQTVSPDKLTTTTEYKREKLIIKKFDQDAWKRIVGTTDFEEKPPEVKSSRGPLMNLAPWSSTALKFITYILIIGIAVFIVYFVLKNSTISSIKAKSVATVPGDFATGGDDIVVFDMEAQLLQAQASGNLRLVVRIYYLGLLKKLNEAEKIAWKKDKTNLEYLMELFSNNYFYEEVRKLTMAYEIVWYGERTITREPFDELIRDFEAMHQQINIHNT